MILTLRKKRDYVTYNLYQAFFDTSKILNKFYSDVCFWVVEPKNLKSEFDIFDLSKNSTGYTILTCDNGDPVIFLHDNSNNNYRENGHYVALKLGMYRNANIDGQLKDDTGGHCIIGNSFVDIGKGGIVLLDQNVIRSSIIRIVDVRGSVFFADYKENYL